MRKNKGREWKEKNHSRYGENYHNICKASHQATNSQCCICLIKSTPENPNKNHHSCYRDEHGLITDRELAGYHVFSVCDACHVPICHDKKNWMRFEDESYNRNTDEFMQRLQLGFAIANNTG